MFDMLGRVGFVADDIFYDTAVVPIAADLEAKRARQTMTASAPSPTTLTSPDTDARWVVQLLAHDAQPPRREPGVPARRA